MRRLLLLANAALALPLLACTSAPGGVHLDQVAPATACPGDRLDLFGGGFGTPAHASFVTVGGTSILPGDAGRVDAGRTLPGRILDWEDNHIAVLVPALAGGARLVTVTVSSGAVSNPRPVEILSACGSAHDGG